MAKGGRVKGPYHWQGETLILNLQVQPGASHDRWVGCHGDAFKVRLTTSPVNGKANAHLIMYMARLFGVARSQISLLAGETERHKRVSIESPVDFPPEIPPRQ